MTVTIIDRCCESFLILELLGLTHHVSKSDNVGLFIYWKLSKIRPIHCTGRQMLSWYSWIQWLRIRNRTQWETKRFVKFNQHFLGFVTCSSSSNSLNISLSRFMWNKALSDDPQLTKYLRLYGQKCVWRLRYRTADSSPNAQHAMQCDHQLHPAPKPSFLARSAPEPEKGF